MKTEWISVKDKLPEPGELVLCYFDGILNEYYRMKKKNDTVSGFGTSKHHVVRELITKNGERWADEGVTHWMPLPEPPSL